MLEKSILSGRGRTYYWTEKRDSPFSLVFLPGLTANHHLFDRQTEAFSERYDTIVWDAPAHGKSRPYKDFSYHNAAGELKSILDTEGVKRAVLIGQSAGGFVAQSFYKEHADMVAGIFAIGTCPYHPSYYSRSDLFWLRQTRWMFRLYPNGILQRAMTRMCASTPRARENMMHMLEDYTKDELCTLMYMGFAGFIPEICGMTTQCPLWLLVGEHDHTGKVMAYNKLWHKRKGSPCISSAARRTTQTTISRSRSTRCSVRFSRPCNACRLFSITTRRCPNQQAKERCT